MESDTVNSDTVRYSISSYAYRYQNDEKVGEVVREMMKYGKAADAYKYAQ